MSTDNAIAKLLSFDKPSLTKKQETHKMALTKLDGAVIPFELVQMTAEQAYNIQDMRAEYEQATGVVKTHSYKPTAQTIMAGCPSVFKNNEVRKHYGCNTFEELVGVLLTKSEMEELEKAIEELSDADTSAFDVSDSEVKN